MMLGAVIHFLLMTVLVLLSIGCVLAVPVAIALVRHMRRHRPQAHGAKP